MPPRKDSHSNGARPKHLLVPKFEGYRESGSQSDITTQQQSPTKRGKNSAVHSKKTQHHDQDYDEDGHDKRRYEVPDNYDGRAHLQFEDSHLPTRSELSNNISNVSKLVVYEHMLRLRKHGFSIKLGPESVAAMDRLAAMEPLSIRSDGFDDQYSAVDVHNPAPQEMVRVNHAIATLVSIQAHLEVSAFEVPPVFECAGCHEKFSTHNEKEDHCKKGPLTSCRLCSKSFICSNTREEHVRLSHPQTPTTSRPTADQFQPHWETTFNQNPAHQSPYLDRA